VSRDTRGAVLLAAIVLFYAVLGLVVLAPEAVYSGDIGVKYVQARTLVSHRFASLDIPYPGELVDPAREFFPIRPPFVMVSNGATQAIFPPVSAVIQALAVAIAGFRGIVGLSIVAAGVVLYASWKLAPHEYGAAVLIALGLGGPLWFYAVSGWEHAPAVAFGTAAFACASVVSARWSALAAGALLGAGATLRDEVALLLPGLLVVIWLRSRKTRPVFTAIAGLAVPLAFSAALEVWWFQRPPAVHLRHAVHIVQTALHVTSEPNPDVPVLQPMTLRERYDTIVVYWILGRGSDRQVTLFTAGLIAAFAMRWRWRSSVGFLIWLLAFGVTAVTDLWEVVTAPKFLAGLVRVSPYVVLALLPRAAAPARKLPDATGCAAWLPRAIVFTVAAYLLIAFAGVDTSGGKSLGPRLLLPLLPLLTVAAMTILGSYVRSDRTVDRWVGYVGGALVAVAVVIHVGGTIPAYRMRTTEDARAVRAAAASPERIVVADDMFTAQLLLPLYDRKIILLADSALLGQKLGALLQAQHLGSAILVSRNPEPAVGLPPLRLDRTEPQGRMVIQYWRR
jgi:hypothetical protein